MTRTLDTLIQQALMMQDLDRAAGDTVMVKGWYADLLPEEKEAFDGWIVLMIERLTATFGGFREELVKLGENLTKAFAEGFEGKIVREKVIDYRDYYQPHKLCKMDNSGLWESTDGGKTWELAIKLQNPT